MVDEAALLLEPEKEFQKQYQRSKWWVEHRSALTRLGLVAFACMDAVFLLFAAWSFADAYLLSYAEERRAVLELAAYGQADLHGYTQENRARPLEAGTVAVLASDAGKYDLHATLSNPNDDWWAEFTYAFSWSGGQTDLVRAFILPASEKSLVAFAVESSASPRSVTVTVTDVVWHRVDHHTTGDYARWIEDRLNFVIENPVFERVDLEGNVVGRVTFSVTNATAFHYYEPTFLIRLTRGTSLVGVTAVTLADLGAGETRDISATWVGSLPAVTKVEVDVEINVFDTGVYKPLQGETVEDTRTRVFPRSR